MRLHRILYGFTAFLLLTTTACFASGCGNKAVLYDISEGTETGGNEHNETDETDETDETGSSVSEEMESSEDSSEEIRENREEEPERICVFVCGQVVNPGVYELEQGSRIVDALALSGGLTTEANLSAVNQAEYLTDGEKIYIPALGELYEPLTVTPGGNSDASTVATGQTDAGDAKVDLNRATKEELMTLPGIGETKAAAILAYRDTKGRFETIEELKEVPGIKEGTFRQVEDYLTAN